MNATAFLESINIQVAYIAARHAELFAATNYLELLPGIKENKIFNFIKTNERLWDVCHSTGDQGRCGCAGTLRNINRDGLIVVSIRVNILLLFN